MVPVPVTVVGGFLGAGKTTLINRVLGEPHGLAIAVIVNDIGSVDIDAQLLTEIGANVVRINNGCVCCSMRTDLVTQVAALAAEQRYDRIVIETSGISEPGNVIRGLRYPRLCGKVSDASVITIIDAEYFPRLAGDLRYLAHEQLAAADVVLLNKSDLVSSEQLKSVTLQCACPGLTIVECRHADVPLDVIFCAGNSANRDYAPPNHEKSSSEIFESRTWEPNGPVSLTFLREALDALPASVVRVKGFVESHDTGDCWLIQRAGSRVSLIKTASKHAPALVLIARRSRIDWCTCIGSLNSCVDIANCRGMRNAPSGTIG